MSESKNYLDGLGPNERAIIERIPFRPLRVFVVGVVRAKMRMQFTGWLQYLLPLIPILILALLALVSLLFNVSFLAGVFGGLGGLVLLIALFDIVTIKFKIRPPERIPHPLDHHNAFDLMRARHSCRSFQTRKLTKTHHSALMESALTHLAEAQIGTAPIRFEYIDTPLNVWPTVNASEFFVAITAKDYDRTAIIDVGRSLQKVVTDATALNLGTCWIGPGADHASVMANLGERFDPNKDQIICVLAVGYKSKFIPLFIRLFNARMSTSRLPLSELFFTDATFITPLDVTSAPFDKFGQAYEMCRWAPSSYNGQTTRCAAVTDENGTLQGFDFYATTASRYYAPIALGIWAANWELSVAALGLTGHFTVQQQKAGESLLRYDLSWVLSSF